MRKPALALLALATALAISPAALADNFNFAFIGLYSGAPGYMTGNVMYGYGTLSGVEVSPGLYDITSGTFDILGGSNTFVTGAINLIPDPTPGVTALSPDGVLGYDDTVSITGGVAYANDLLFATPGYGTVLPYSWGYGPLPIPYWSPIPDAIEIQVSLGGGSGEVTEFNDIEAQGNPGDWDCADENVGVGYVVPAVPEPPSWLLLGTGLLGFAIVLRQKRVYTHSS